MALSEIQFPTISEPGAKPVLSSGRLTNAILEQLQDGRIARIRAPGLRLLSPDVDEEITFCRGMIAANTGTLLVVANGKVEARTSSGLVRTDLGPLAGSDTVTLARNNASPTPDIVCVSPGNGAFVLTAGGAPAAYPDVDVESPNSVCFGDGYFFFTYGDGRVKSTGINSTSINALDVARAESSSRGLLRGVFHRGLLFLFGPETIEVWQNAANPTGFPFSRAAVIPRGLAGTNAVAGWEANFPSTLIFVGSDNIVYTLNGYEPVRISTHDIERDLQALTDKSSLRCFVAMHNGHPYWFMKSNSWTLARDLLTSTWQERKSYGRSNWRGEQSVFMWGDWLIGDDASGQLGRLDNRTFKEYADALVYEVESVPSKSFPNRTTISRADFMFAPGLGNIVGDLATDGDPSCLVYWSNDGGVTWGNPLERPLGKGGRYHERVTVNRTGQAGVMGRKWKLRVSDPVYVALTGGTMEVQADTF